MSWTTYIVYNFADDLHWPELGILLDLVGSMCEDPLKAAIHFERRFDALMNMLLTVRNIPLERSKIYFIESNLKLEVIAITW